MMAAAIERFVARSVLGMLRTDGLRILRDQFLIGMAALILGICLALRLGIPWITNELMERWAFDLTPYYPLLAGHVSVVLPTVTVGILGGFILLETREEKVIKALLVSPVRLRRYLHIWSGVMVVAGLFFAAVHALIIGLALPPLPALVLIALAAATAAPAKAMYMASFAANKVEAMAYTKFVSGAAPIALVAYFIPEPWQYLAGIYPPYWAAKAYWLAVAGESSWPFWALGAPVMSAFWWWVFARSFRKAAHR